MLEKMKEIIAEQLGVEEDEITPDTSFKEDLGADYGVRRRVRYRDSCRRT